ncbi:MAG: hypothetical protein Q9227_003195 [Pyrenula ochraceoflavens]
MTDAVAAGNGETLSSIALESEKDADSAVNSTPTSSPASTPPEALVAPAQKLKGWRLVVVETCLCLGLLFSAIDASIVSTALVTIGTYFNEFVSVSITSKRWKSKADGPVIPEVTPNKYFSFMTGAQGAIFAISSILGPVLGGVIAARTTWRWIFYFTVPFGVVIASTLLVAWPSKGVVHLGGQLDWRTMAKNLKYFDYQGVALLTATSVLLIVGLQSGGSAVAAWDSPLVITTITAAGICCIALILWNIYRERKWKSTRIAPLFPFRLLKIHNVSAAFM